MAEDAANARTSSNLPPRIFVGNYPYNTPEADLHRLFSTCGEIISLKPFRQRGTERGCCLVQYAARAAADRAIETLHDTDFNGRRLNVEFSRHDVGPREPSPPRYHHDLPPYRAPPPIYRDDVLPYRDRYDDRYPYARDLYDRYPYDRDPYARDMYERRDRDPYGRFDRYEAFPDRRYDRPSPERRPRDDAYGPMDDRRRRF
jgi:RNA recognition motif-containing protein